MNDYVLTIDAGNTRMKWGVFSPDRQLQQHGASMNAELVDLIDIDSFRTAWQKCRRAVLSNVAGPAMQHAVTVLLQRLNIPLYVAKASAHACNVSNGYQHADMLGTDRWAALIAAWNEHHQPCLVINAGTALTIDAINTATEPGQGRFLGGLILPGLRLMQQSLVDATAGITAQPGTMQDFPINTADALHTGAMSAMTGAVVQMLGKLQQCVDRPSQLSCIISGGDAELLAEALRHASGMDLAMSPSSPSRTDQLNIRHITIDQHLVLKGLLLLERDAA